MVYRKGCTTSMVQKNDVYEMLYIQYRTGKLCILNVVQVNIVQKMSQGNILQKNVVQKMLYRQSCTVKLCTESIVQKNVVL